MRDDVVVEPATAADAAELQRVSAAAFAAREPLDPPSPAVDEPVEVVAAELEQHGGVVVRLAGEVVAGLRLHVEPEEVRLRRVAVDPAHQGRGLGTRMVLWTQAHLARQRAAGVITVDHVAADARRELPANQRFWELLEYAADAQTELPAHLIRYRRQLPVALEVATADAMRALGERIARELRPGDLVLLHGELGAGKTTLTQGIAAGLAVRGAVTSPTFVISRVHPGELPLVHVDGYRLGAGAEVDDLDLDASLEESVTVVEWGEGLVERLSTARLEVRIERSAVEGEERRLVVVEGFGERWREGPRAFV